MAKKKWKSTKKAKNVQPRAVIYARCGSLEKGDRDVEAQIAACRRFLEGRDGQVPEVLVESDEGASGATLSRPGIQRAVETIKAKQCIRVVACDLERFYTDPVWVVHLLDICKANGVRVMTVDGFDSMEPDAEIQLLTTQFRRKRTSADFARCVRLAVLDRWPLGHAMGTPRPGYRRVPANPEEYARTGHGAVKDVRDDGATDTIVEAFERIAAGEETPQVAEFMNACGTVTRAYTTEPLKWNARRVRAMILCTLYRGVETYCQRSSLEDTGPGATANAGNGGYTVMTRPMPHLAHVTEELWNRANKRLRHRRNKIKHIEAYGHEQGIATSITQSPQDGHTLPANSASNGASIKEDMA